MPNNDMQYHMRMREWSMNRLQNKMATQTRIKELRDDPIAAAHSTRYQSKITRLSRYSHNVERVQSDYRIEEGYMKSAGDILHRVRELALQGATGTFSAEEKKYMGEEVNQLLNELLEITNARSGDGTTIFSGDRTQSQAFRALSGNIPGVNGKVITSVVYTGSIYKNQAEISEGSYIATNMPGNQVFWAEQQQLFSKIDAQNYQVAENTGIRIDGEVIELKAGDNVHTIISRINNSNAAVKAGLDPVDNSFIIRTTSPHQLWLEDVKEGSVLKDLGLINSTGRVPENIADDATLSGGSMFDMIIYLRDSLYKGNTIDIGGSALKGLDLAQNNLIASIAELGSMDERLEYVNKRLLYEIPELKQKNSKEVDLDFAEAITELKMLEFNHKVALQTASRILQPTLLDFLR